MDSICEPSNERSGGATGDPSDWESDRKSGARPSEMSEELGTKNTEPDPGTDSFESRALCRKDLVDQWKFRFYPLTVPAFRRALESHSCAAMTLSVALLQLGKRFTLLAAQSDRRQSGTRLASSGGSSGVVDPLCAHGPYAYPTRLSVIEDLAADLMNGNPTPDASACDVGAARMIQLTAAAFVIEALLNIAQFHQQTSVPSLITLTCVWFNLFLGLGSLLVAGTEAFTARWRQAIFFFLIALLAGNTVLGTIGKEPLQLFMSLIILMVGTGILLPWSVKLQISFDLLCLGTWALQIFWNFSHDDFGSYKIAGVIMAAAVSYFACAGRESSIEERKESERKIRENEITLRQIFDANTDGIALIDFETRRLIDVNTQFLRLSGFQRHEVVGKTSREVNVWTDSAAEAEFARRIQTEGAVKNMEVDCRRKDGKLVPCLLSSVVLKVRGKHTMMTIARDIAEVRESQDRLRESEATLRAMFDHSLDCIWLLDWNTHVLVESNEEFRRVMGYTRDEMVGKRFEELVRPVDPARLEQFAQLLESGSEVRNFEINFCNRSGRQFHALLSAAAVTIAGKPYLLTMARDITDLVSAREAALTASRAKSEFLSIMSHEIRTPMNAILGMAELVGESDLGFEQRRYLDTIIGNGNSLLTLINGILDLAKVESGKLALEASEFDIEELADSVVETLAARVYEKHLELSLRFASDLPTAVVGDQYRLRQILNNVIGNAIKFTDKGEIVVEIALNRDSRNPGNYLFVVRDTGIGIPPDKLEKVFGAFTQADTSTTRRFGGSGLGLTIVERLVAMMGGCVWIESELGKGSAFFITVDLKTTRSTSQEEFSGTQHLLSDVGTLLIAPNATVRTTVADSLRSKGAQVTEVASEPEAFAAIDCAARSGHLPELLLVDCDTVLEESSIDLHRIRAAQPNAAVVLLLSPRGLGARLRFMRSENLQYSIRRCPTSGWVRPTDSPKSACSMMRTGTRPISPTFKPSARLSSAARVARAFATAPTRSSLMGSFLGLSARLLTDSNLVAARKEGSGIDACAA
jgi:PAS domain S-box-containing protein